MSNTIKTDVNAEVGNILILHMKGKMMIGEAIRQIEKLYHAQPPAQKEEPKEGSEDFDFHDPVICSYLIKSLESQIATLKAAETFSLEQMIGFPEWLSAEDWYYEAYGRWQRDQGEFKTTTDLLNEFLKQKQ